MPTGLAAVHYSFDLGSDDVPYLLPALSSRLPKRARMFVFANAGAICVVVKLDELVAPPEEHRVA
jgi:hypothetical protein